MKIHTQLLSSVVQLLVNLSYFGSVLTSDDSTTCPTLTPGSGEIYTSYDNGLLVIVVSAVSLLLIVTLITVIIIQCLLIFRKRKSGAVIHDTNNNMNISVMPNKAYVLHKITWSREREEINRW